jgi:hypothetical protein
MPLTSSTHLEMKEKNSSKKVLVWSRSPNQEEDYIGSIFIKDGKIMTEAKTEEEKIFLFDLFSDQWIPQSGIPLLKKDSAGGFEKNDQGKFITEAYAHFGSHSIDEVLEAFYDFLRAMEVFRVELDVYTG